MKPLTLSLILAVLCAAPAYPAEDDPNADRTSRRLGPKYQSYLNGLPIDSFVEAVSLEKLSEVIVTDTKVAQPQESVTQRVQVLYGDDFEVQSLHNRNVAELLRHRPGLFVNVLSRNDANWGSFGGLGPKYNEYLLDGLPVDSFVDAMSLDPWAFDRIEMHEGPASVMYSNYLTMDFAGNETPLAGITNFVLKGRIDAPATRFQLGFGSYDTVDGRVFHQDHKGNFHYFLGADFEKSRYTNYGTETSWLNIQGDPQYQKTKLYAKMTYVLGRDDHDVSLFVHHTQHTGDAGRPNRDFDHEYDTVNLVYANQVSDRWNLSVKAGYRNYDRRWAEDNAGLTPPDLSLREHDGARQRIFPADLTLTYRHAGSSLLTVGADAQAASYRTYAEVAGGRSTGNDVSASSTGLFLQEKLLLGNWVLRGGARFNHTGHTYYAIGNETPEVTGRSWDRLLWSLGVRYNLSPVVALYANSGSSFVAPSAKSVGGTLADSALGVPGMDGQLPNPSLKPESGTATDAGIDLRFRRNLTVGVRGFTNRIDDAIVENVVSTTPSQSRSVNAGTASSWGVEFSAEQAVTSRFEWFANLTFASTNVMNPLDPDQDRTDIPFVPDVVANAGMTIQLPFGIAASPYLHMVGTYYDSTSRSSRRAFGPYQELNLRLSASLLRTTNVAMNAAVDLNNLTDRRYEMPFQFREPGFNAFGNLRLTF